MQRYAHRGPAWCHPAYTIDRPALPRNPPWPILTPSIFFCWSKKGAPAMFIVHAISKGERVTGVDETQFIRRDLCWRDPAVPEWLGVCPDVNPTPIDIFIKKIGKVNPTQEFIVLGMDSFQDLARFDKYPKKQYRTGHSFEENKNG